MVSVRHRRRRLHPVAGINSFCLVNHSLDNELDDNI